MRRHIPDQLGSTFLWGFVSDVVVWIISTPRLTGRCTAPSDVRLLLRFPDRFPSLHDLQKVIALLSLDVGEGPNLMLWANPKTSHGSQDALPSGFVCARPEAVYTCGQGKGHAMNSGRYVRFKIMACLGSAHT